MKKSLLFALSLAAMIVAFAGAQDYTGPTTASATDNERTSLQKLVKIAHDGAHPAQYAALDDGAGDASIKTAGGSLGTLAAGQKIFIQNLGTAPLFVKKGAGASASSLHLVLGAGNADDDGRGGYIEIADWIGVVSVAGDSPRYVFHISQ